jgi:uncharacterized protein YbcV (DUF1398 family)
MNDQVKQITEECTKASDEERVSFGDVVMRLMQAGIERYHADLLRDEKIYHVPDGSSHLVPSAAISHAAAQGFSASGVEAAVRAVQAGRIGYRKFCEDVMAAGCVGYLVSIAGRRVVYYGRTGEMHEELFPATK